MNPAPPTFWRSPRLKPPLPYETITIPDPPSDPTSGGSGSVMALLLPSLAMVVVMVAVALLMNMRTMLAFSVPMVLTSGLVTAGLFMSQRRKARAAAAQRKQGYESIINETEERLARLQKQQSNLRHENDPDPQESMRRLCDLERRLWSRRPDDDDFLCLRLGLGDLPSTVTVKTPAVRDAVNPDPLVVQAVQMAQHYTLIANAPFTLDVRASGVIGFAGERTPLLGVTFAAIAALATYHAPAEVKLAVIYGPNERDAWKWVRWLPHTWSDDHQVRYVAEDDATATQTLAAIERLLDARRRLADDQKANAETPFAMVVFIANEHVVEANSVIDRLQFEGPELGIYPLFLSARVKLLPQSCRVVVRLVDGQAHLIRQGVASDGALFEVDYAAPEFMDSFARKMAAIRLRQAQARDIPSMVTFLDQMHVTRVEEMQVGRRWQQNALNGNKLTAVVGTAPGQEPLALDLHEKAHGPNCLVAGTVGAGKSELLQTLVAMLAVEHHPHHLAFVLIDYKGGGMATPFVHMPHTLGVITNLQIEGLARRALTSLTVELARRQEVFDAADVKHIDEYQRKYDAGRLPADAEPVPYLIVIVDEYAEMKIEQPEVAKEFVRIAHIGRSLGFRLILAMQKPAGIVDDQIEANTRFRLCLRVAQTDDSMAMLKRPDAAYLVGRGRCLLQVGANEIYREFQVAWAGAHYASQNAIDADRFRIVQIVLGGGKRTLIASDVSPLDEDRTQLTAVVEEIRSEAAAQNIRKLNTLWLPPLPAQLALDAIRPDEGWDGAQWRPTATWMAPVIGVIDRPRERSQTPYALALGSAGHLAIYGAPGFGKTTALQTIAASLVRSYSPADLNMYILDYGGRLLKGLERFPQVGAVITADEEERLDRLGLYLRKTIEERRALLGAAGVNSLAAYREYTGAQMPAIVVLLDNYANYVEAAAEDDNRLNLIARIAQDGSNLGVHLVLTANHSATVRFAISSNIMQAIALHMVENSEYGAVVGRIDGVEPPAQPGRGLVRGNPVLECQIAFPAPGATDAERSQNLRLLASAMSEAWHGPTPMQIGVLPELVPLEPLLATLPSTAQGGANGALRLPLGLHIDDLSPFVLELERDAHLLIAGTSRSGCSTVLRSLVRSLASTTTADACRLIILDSRRQSLAALRTLPLVTAYACDAQEAEEQLRAIEQQLADMHAGAHAQRAEAQHIFVLIDDMGDPASSISQTARDLLGRLLRDGRGYPFHLIVAGRLRDLMENSYSEPTKFLKEAQTGFILGTGDDGLFNARLTYQERNRTLPAGEAYYINRGTPRRVKIAMSD